MSIDVDISTIGYGEKDLTQWIETFTVLSPKMPSTALQIQQSIADLNNKYQLAYNCYSELEAICAINKAEYDTELNKYVDSKMAELREHGINKMPAKDTIISMASNSEEVKVKKSEFDVVCLLRDFFLCHKTKLEKSMQLFVNMSYSITSSDKIYEKGIYNDR